MNLLDDLLGEGATRVILGDERMEVKQITLKMTPKEAEVLMEKMNDEINALNAENGRLRDAGIQALAALTSADVHGYQNSLCKSKAIELLREALAEGK